MNLGRDGTRALIRSCGPADAIAVSAVLASAFPEKFAAIFGRHLDGGMRFLAAEYARRPDAASVLVAEECSEVVGALEVSWADGKRGRGMRFFGAMRKEMGLRAATHAAFAFRLLTARALEDGCAYINFLGVLPAHRGRGVGRRLLEQGAHRARLAGKRRLVLEVAANNRQAIRLYRKSGFRRVRSYRSRLTLRMFGCGAWEVWELAL